MNLTDSNKINTNNAPDKTDKLAHIEPIALFLPEFCKRYCISRSTFYREVHANRLRVFKRGKLTMVERTEAEHWYASLQRGIGNPVY